MSEFLPLLSRNESRAPGYGEMLSIRTSGITGRAGGKRVLAVVTVPDQV